MHNFSTRPLYLGKATSVFSLALVISLSHAGLASAGNDRGSESSATQTTPQSYIQANSPAESPLYAQVSSGNISMISGEFSRFAPQTKTKSTRIDYSIWDEALASVVLDLGPSTRIRAPRPQAGVGSRMVRGHKSAYRLEGSRFTFSYITDEYRAGLTEYRKDLQSLPSRLDITRLSRDEQLAYWINLHNVAVIEQIALAYPTQRPANVKIKVNGRKVKLDEAKFIDINGVAMSPKDIRTQIVYPNWSDPNVIYGFYRGDIGSPMLPRYAYDAENLDYTLDDNGYEFANSLRGFHRTLGHRNVSAIYEEAAPFYFQNWDRDLTAHLSGLVKDELKDDLNTGEPFRIDRYDTMVADLSGGQRLASSGSPVSGQMGMSAETARLLGEVRKKQDVLRGRGEIGQQPKGWVIIEDLYTEDPDAPPSQPQEQNE